MALKETPEIVNVVLGVAGAESAEQVIPMDVQAFDVQSRGNGPIRMSLGAAGTTNGPYWTMKAATTYYKEVPMNTPGFSLYFMDPTNDGTVIELLLWRNRGLS